MSQLQDNLDEILRQKQEVLIPENVKSGITYLGQTGTYTGETIHDAFKVFESVALMNADTDKEENDRAIVIQTNHRNPKLSEGFSEIYLPEQFVLTEIPEAAQFGSGSVSYTAQLVAVNSMGPSISTQTIEIIYNSIDGENITGRFAINIPEFGINMEWNSDDCLTWVRTNYGTVTDEVYTLPGYYTLTNRDIDTEESIPPILEIMQITSYDIQGMYICTVEDKTAGGIIKNYVPLTTQLSTITASDVFAGKTVMGRNVVVTGEYTEAISQQELNTAVDTTEDILGTGAPTPTEHPLTGVSTNDIENLPAQSVLLVTCTSVDETNSYINVQFENLNSVDNISGVWYFTFQEEYNGEDLEWSGETYQQSLTKSISGGATEYDTMYVEPSVLAQARFFKVRYDNG